MRSRNLFLSLAVVLLSLFCSSATAQLVIYEPGDYYLGATDSRVDNYLGFMWNGNNPSGLPANNTNLVAPLTGNSTGLRNNMGADIKIVEGLTYSNSGGTMATHANALQQTSAGWSAASMNVYRKLTILPDALNSLDPYAAYRNGDNFGWNAAGATPRSLYYSFLLKVSDLTGPAKQFMLKGSGDFIFQQNETNSKWQFKTPTTAPDSLGIAVANQTVLMVTKLTFTDATHSTVSVWFNPTLGTALPAPAFTYNLGAITFNGFQFKDGNNKLIADEIRVGLTEADVMPLVNATLPAAPTALAATAVTSGGFTLGWNASATPGVTYEIYKNGYSIGTSATNSFAVTTEGGVFNYSVKAVLGAAKSEYSVGLSQSLDPIAPTALALTPGTITSDGFDLTWTASVTPGVTYEIFRDWVSVGTVAAGVTTFKVTGCPTPNLNYFMVVKSVLGGVKSSPSNIANIKTGPAAPTALTLSAITTGSATLTWAASATSGVTYDVYQNGVKIGSTLAGVLTYNVIGLADKMNYVYTVKALLGGLSSTATAPASIIRSSLVIYDPADYSIGATDSRVDNYLGFMWNGNNPSGLPFDNTNIIAPHTGRGTGLRNNIGFDTKIVEGLTYSNTGGTLATHANAFQQTTAGWSAATMNVYRKLTILPDALNSLDPYAAYRNGDNFGWNAAGATPRSLYYSFLLKVSDLTGPAKQFMLKGSGDFIFQQNETNSKWQFKTPTTAPDSLGIAVANQTVLMVTKLTFTDATHSTVSVWFNPTLGTALPAPAFTYNQGAITFSGFQFKDGNNKLTADEIRVGLTEADVMPLVNAALPAAPTALAATAVTTGGFTLGWTASVTPAVTYEVYKNGYSIGTSATNSFAVTTEGGVFNYSVKAVLGANKSEYSVGLSQSADPIAPTALTLTVGTTVTDGYNVSWTASVTPGVSYEIFRDWVSVGTVDAGVTNFTVTGCPTPNLNYYIVVKSVLGGVKSSPSNIGNYKTGPAAPTALVASAVEATTATLTWTASATSGVTYEVYQAGVKIGVTAAGVVTYNVTGLTANTLYSFTVKAVLSGLYSTASAALPVTTKLNNALDDVYSKVNIYVANAKIVVDLNGLSGAQTITVYNVQGKSIINRKATGGEKLTLANNLMKGVYVVKVQGAEATIVNKLIVKQ